MRKRDRRTREQRKTDASAWMGFMCFLALLLIEWGVSRRVA